MAELDCKIKFNFEVGALLRNQMRGALNKLKADILYHEPMANVEIVERKGFLESRFDVYVTMIDENTGLSIKRSVEKFARQYA